MSVSRTVSQNVRWGLANGALFAGPLGGFIRWNQTWGREGDGPGQQPGQ